MIILDGRVEAQKKKILLQQEFTDEFRKNSYIAIFLLSDDYASRVYVNMKKKF